MSQRVIVMSGVSGSGKSTRAQKLVASQNDSTIVSADNFFIAQDGVYRFDHSKLSDAHAACFRAFLSALQRNVKLVVVDNTNTTAVEIAPYILGAQSHFYAVEIITVMCKKDSDVMVAAKRNSHGVPFEGVRAQHLRLVQRRLPPFWKNIVVNAEF